MSSANKHIALRIRMRLNAMKRSFMRFSIRSARFISACSLILLTLSAVAAAICLVGMVIHLGYDHSPDQYIALHRIFRISQGIFLANIIFNLALRFRHTLSHTRSIKWIVDITLLVTLLPLIYPHPVNPWLPWLEQLLYSNKFLYISLAAYSIVTLSYALFRLVGKRTNPSLLLSGSFLTFIIIGSFLLMLPKCTYSGISYIDSLFVSTSAICITGLTPIDVSATFTPLGLVTLSLLIQIGALGVMTFTSFFALFFSGSTSIYSQLLLRDMIYSKSMSALVPTLLYILSFTLIIEFAGACLIFASIHGTLNMTLESEITFSAFHSLSAFCNAGFSNFPDGLSNPLLLNSNISIYWIMTILIIAGSIGFPILVNFKDALATRLHGFLSHIHHRPSDDTPAHLYNMNTKIVLTTFFWLFIAGTLLFLVLEWDNTLASMSLTEKITQAVFNSATPRSAGFSSVSPARFLNVTLIIILFLMWIGGASQSTGGGIKVNTFAAILLNLKAIVTGAPKVTAYRRTIATGSIRRANAVVAISIISYLILSATLLWLEPSLPARDLLFEASSALFTVGSSLGVTDKLSPASEIILCLAMFLGRVGIISLLTGIVRHRKMHQTFYPSDNIIIN